MATLGNLNSPLLKFGPTPGSESPTFVPAVLLDQAMGSAMLNAPAMQEERAGGHELHSCAVRVILSEPSQIRIEDRRIGILTWSIFILISP